MVDFMAIILFGIFINIVKNGNAFEYIQISDFCIYEICLTGILWVIYNACNLIKYFKAKKKQKYKKLFGEKTMKYYVKALIAFVVILLLQI